MVAKLKANIKIQLISTHYFFPSRNLNISLPVFQTFASALNTSNATTQWFLS